MPRRTPRSPQCSYKGGDPGFVRVLDEQTIAFPNYDGNGMYLSMGNLLENPQVGLLFIDFTAVRPSRLRLNGSPVSTIGWADRGVPRRSIRRQGPCHPVFPNCPRYIHRMALVERSRFVPHADRETPFRTGNAPTGRATYCPQADPARTSGRDSPPLT